MDPASLAAALVGAQMSSVQMAMSAKMLRMNADSAASVAQMIDSAQQNVTNLANVGAGLGQNLDISV
jgi:hypothetical protein